MRIVFLVSGGGGSMKFVNDFITQNKQDINLAGVIGDRDCGGIEYAKTHNIPYRKIKYNKQDAQSCSELKEILDEYHPDIIVTNIHKIIDSVTLSAYPNKFINLHYSLLPAFAGFIGMKTIEEAKKFNVCFIGATCHYVNEQLDGGKIISQCSFPVDWDQPNQLIVDTVFKSACLILFNSILFKYENDHSIVKKNIEIRINSNNVSFNPTLDFDPEKALSLFP